MSDSKNATDLSDPIQYELDDDGISTVTLNRPDAMNAVTAAMLRELVEVFDRADADDRVRAVIVTGAGRAFCAGADLAAGEASFSAETWDAVRSSEQGEVVRDAGGLLSLRLFDLKKPVIAAVNGAAVGVGATMLLPMDARLAAEGARFGFVFTRRGIVPEACSSWFLPRLVGISRALEWTLTGRVFDASEALAGGLVRSLHPPEELLAAARALALEMSASTSAVSVALARQMMWKMLGADHPMAAHQVDSRGMSAMGESADCHEGVRSFLEKRPPRFTMRPSVDLPAFYPWWKPRRFE